MKSQKYHIVAIFTASIFAFITSFVLWRILTIISAPILLVRYISTYWQLILASNFMLCVGFPLIAKDWRGGFLCK